MSAENVTEDIFYKAMLHGHMLFVAEQRYCGGVVACIAEEGLCAAIQEWLTGGDNDWSAMSGVLNAVAWYPYYTHNTVMEAVAHLAASLIKLDERVSLKESLWPQYVATVNRAIKAALESHDANDKLERMAIWMQTNVRNETALTDSDRLQNFEAAVKALIPHYTG